MARQTINTSRQPGTARGNQPKISRKEATQSLIFCLVVLVGLSIYKHFDAKQQEQNTPQPSAIVQTTGEQTLSAADAQALSVQWPTVSEPWRVMVLADQSLVLISPGITDLSTDALSQPGYEITTDVRVHVTDTAALQALLSHLSSPQPIVRVQGAEGVTVDNVLYAAIADAVRANKMDVELVP